MVEPIHSRQGRQLQVVRASAPASLARTGRQVLLHLADKSHWADLIRKGIDRLRALAVPG